MNIRDITPAQAAAIYDCTRGFNHDVPMRSWQLEDGSGTIYIKTYNVKYRIERDGFTRNSDAGGQPAPHVDRSPVKINVPDVHIHVELDGREIANHVAKNIRLKVERDLQVRIDVLHEL